MVGRLSADGGRLAVEVRDDLNADIWVYEPHRDTMTRLTFGGQPYAWPTWSPDGHYVVFACYGTGLFWARADGAGQPQQLTQSKMSETPQSFSPDGKRLAYFEVSSLGASAPRMQMWTVPIEDVGGGLRTGKAEPFLQTQFSDGGGMFSPDGQWLAYSSNEPGTREVYVRAFPQPASGQGGKWQISNGGGFWPRWSGKSRELFYDSGDEIMAVNYAVNGDSFVPEKPRVWASKLGDVRGFDVSPDGKRVAVVMPVETPEGTKPHHEVTIIFNFLDELRRRVPAGK
jgi:eukaryotic-like serine/threonine-protein kinase